MSAIAPANSSATPIVVYVLSAPLSRQCRFPLSPTDMAAPYGGDANQAFRPQKRASPLFIGLGFSHDRRLEVFVLLVFFLVLVIVVIGISRRQSEDGERGRIDPGGQAVWQWGADHLHLTTMLCEQTTDRSLVSRARNSATDLSTALDQLGQLSTRIEHARLHSRGKDSQYRRAFVDRLLVIVDQLDDLSMFGRQPDQRLAQHLATILFLQGSFGVIRWVGDGSLDLFVQFGVYPTAPCRQCLKAGNGY